MVLINYLWKITFFDCYRGNSGLSNSQLWNAMMHPFTKMTVKGAIWYQGLYRYNNMYMYIIGKGINVHICHFYLHLLRLFYALWFSLCDSGEANAHKPDSYKCTFPTMIDDWRQKFSAASGTASDFPFGFVQVRPGTRSGYLCCLHPIRCRFVSWIVWSIYICLLNCFTSVLWTLLHFWERSGLRSRSKQLTNPT